MRARRPDGPTIVGILLVLLGLAWLLGRVANVDMTQVPWPLYVIVPGVVVFLLGVPARDRGGEGLAVVGAMVTVTGPDPPVPGRHRALGELGIRVGPDRSGRRGVGTASIWPARRAARLDRFRGPHGAGGACHLPGG